MDASLLLDFMKSRRSIRAFTRETVPEEAINQILEAMRWCQSASNRQPWRFIVITSPEMIKKLEGTATYGKFISQAPVVIAIVADTKKAPKWYIHDTSMVSHQGCLMAWALGLGTCWIGSMDRDKAGKILGLSKHEHLTTILPIGYPEEIPRPTVREKLEKMVSRIDA